MLSAAKVAIGVAVVALIVAVTALAGLGYMYIRINQAMTSAEQNNNNNGNSNINNNNQGNTNCGNNCISNGNQTNIQTVISGQSTTLGRCQGNGGGQVPTITTRTAFGGSPCYLSPGQSLTIEFAIGASGLSASFEVTTSGPVNVVFVDQTSNTTIQSQTSVTNGSYSHSLISGHNYEVQVTNAENQNNVLTGTITIS